MTDIVERLREAGADYTVAWGHGDLYDEAADKIERLRADMASMHSDLFARIDRMSAAISLQVMNIERWLETGEPAGPGESQAIYEQLCRAVGREPKP